MGWSLEYFTDLLYPRKISIKLERLSNGKYSLEIHEDLSHLEEEKLQQVASEGIDPWRISSSSELDPRSKILTTKFQGDPVELLSQMIVELLPRMIRNSQDLDGLLNMIRDLGRDWISTLDFLKGLMDKSRD